MTQLIAKMFGGGEKGGVPSPQQALQKLRETEEMLEKKSQYVEGKIQKETQAAKKHGLKNKQGTANLHNYGLLFNQRILIYY